MSEAALSVTETAKLGITWTDIIAFLLEVLHFNILFSQTLVSLIILIILLCIIVKICIISLGLWFQFWLPSMQKKSLGNIVVFWGKASSPLCNVGATWQPEHKHFHSVL